MCTDYKHLLWIIALSSQKWMLRTRTLILQVESGSIDARIARDESGNLVGCITWKMDDEVRCTCRKQEDGNVRKLVACWQINQCCFPCLTGPGHLPLPTPLRAVDHGREGPLAAARHRHVDAKGGDQRSQEEGRHLHEAMRAG